MIKTQTKPIVEPVECTFPLINPGKLKFGPAHLLCPFLVWPSLLSLSIRTGHRIGLRHRRLRRSPQPPCGGAAPPLPTPRGLYALASSLTPTTTRSRRSLLSPRRVPPHPYPPPQLRTSSLQKQRRRRLYPFRNRPDPSPTRYGTMGGATGSFPKPASGAQFAPPLPHGSTVGVYCFLNGVASAR